MDIFQWFFGMPSTVRAFCAFGKYHDIEVEDDVTAYLEYPDGKTVVLTVSTGEAPGTNRLEICADRGKLVVENEKIIFTRAEFPVSKFCRTTTSKYDLPAVWNCEIPSGNDPAHHRKIIQNFVDSIIDGSPIIVKAEEGINSLELANAMLMSSIENKTIELPLDSAKYWKILEELIKNSKFKKNGIIPQN
jgi:predicted dehydrogenase